MTTRTVLTALAFIVVFGAGFLLGSMFGTGTPGVALSTFADQEIRDDNGTNAPSEAATASGGITIHRSDLSSGQQKMLDVLGIDGEEITITPEMVACAKTNIGVERVEELRQGATPTFSEGAALVACYR